MLMRGLVTLGYFAERVISMADRRMFSKAVTETDQFLEMPLSAQALYFHLGLHGDDEGFVGNPKRIVRMTGAAEDDIKLLIAKGFVIAFDSGVVVIRHWQINNYIQADRRKNTLYVAEKSLLLKSGKMKPYILLTESDTECIQAVSEMDTTCTPRGDKRSIDKISIGGAGGTAPTRTRFCPPSVDEVQEYITSMGYRVSAQGFVDYYIANGWKVGKNSMKDWKAAVRTWNSREKDQQPKVVPRPENDISDLTNLYD